MIRNRLRILSLSGPFFLLSLLILLNPIADVPDAHAVDCPANLTVAVSPDGAGTVNPSVGTHVYDLLPGPPDCDVYIENIYATANTGYQFIRWEYSGDISIDTPGDAAAIATITGDASITAVFVAGSSIYPTEYSHDFGNTAVGSATNPFTFTLINEGQVDLEVADVAISGSHSNAFNISSDNCSQQVLAPAGTCTFAVAFAPQIEGTVGAVLYIPTNGDTTINHLSGTGTAPTSGPKISVSPAAFDFGDRILHSDGTPKIFTISNTGDQNLEVDSLVFSSDTGEFGFVEDNCRYTTVPPSGTCTFSVAFSPETEGPKSDTLTIASNAGSVTVDLSGNGIPEGSGTGTDACGDTYDGSGGPWTVPGSPYTVTCHVNVPQGQTLTIEPGATVKFDGDYGIDVFGALVADGTSASPILFTSNADTPSRGDWRAVYFEPGGGTSIMDYCILEYGGGDTGWGWANIAIDGISTVTILNTISRNSYDVGIHVFNDADPTISNCESYGNRYDAMAIEVDAYPVVSGNTAHDNDRWNGAMVYGGYFARSGTFYADTMPYVINDSGASGGNRDIQTGVTLTIEPGTVVKMEDAETLSFNVYGTLHAQGTADKPIVFTSVADDAYLGDTNANGASTGVPADWEEIAIEAGSTQSVITHCIFRFGGQDGFQVGIKTDSVQFEDNTISHSHADGISIQGASPTLTRIRAEDNSDDGITCTNASPTITDSVIINNAGDGINAYSGCSATVSNSDISGNTVYGVSNDDSSVTVDARNNWWGDPSGPGGAGPGTGDPVTSNVLYNPWLGVAPADPGTDPTPTEICGDIYDGSGGPWTVAGSPYTVTCHVNVPQGQVLTIEPGVTVKFDGDYGIDVFGALVADGTSASPILFTSNADTPSRGDWRAVYFEPGGGTSIMDYCILEYGGGDTGWGWANITIDGTSTVTISNTISRNSYDVGIHVFNDADPTISDCEFYGNRYDAMAIEVDAYPVVSGNTAHRNDRWNGIMVEGGHITRSGTWYAGGLSYVINDYGATSGNRNIETGVILTVDPGAIIKMEDNATIEFTIKGTLNAQGTADQPIVFTSVADDDFGGDTDGNGLSTGSPGDWEDIEFMAGSTGSVVTHCTFRYGGRRYGNYSTVTFYTDAVQFEDNTVAYSYADGIKIDGASPILNRVRVEDAAYDGIYVINGASPTIQNSTVLNSGDSGINAKTGSNPVIGNCGLVGNTDYGVLNQDSSITVDARNNWWGHESGPSGEGAGSGDAVSTYVLFDSWLGGAPADPGTDPTPTEICGGIYDGSGGPWTVSGSPYTVTCDVNVPAGQTLTIQPGLTVKFDGNYGIAVNGSLVADGTSSSKILFTSNADTPGRGDWKAIYFEPDGGTSLMDHCIVEYGAGDTSWGWANITIDGISTVTISNTVSRNSYDVGIHVINEADPVISNCELYGHRYDAMAADINSYPVVSGNVAHDNDRWNGIMVLGGHISRSGNWYADTMPYVINDSGVSGGNRNIESGVTLTIEPGTVIKMKDNGTLSFSVFGTLDAQGTADDPIVLTSLADDAYMGDTNADGTSSGSPDDWEDLSIDPGSSNSILKHCIFRYGGQDDFAIGIQTDSLQFDDNVVSYSGSDGIIIENASPALNRITVENSVDDGIVCLDATPTIADSRLVNNGGDGFNGVTGCAAVLNNNDISGNTVYGVSNDDSSVTVDAGSNWWGDASGPGGAGPGTGDPVSNNVLYDPWLGSSPTGEDSTPPVPDPTTPTDPVSGSSGFPVDGSITVTFSEPIQEGDAFADIVLQDPSGSTVPMTKAISGNILTIDPIDNLDPETTYTVLIPAGAVKDMAGLPLAEAFTFDFTTGSGPASKSSVSPFISGRTDGRLYMVYADDRRYNGRYEIYFRKSSDHGATWDGESIIVPTTDTGISDPSFGSPQMAYHDQSLYVLFHTYYSGTFYGHSLIISTDDGTTWNSNDIKTVPGDITARPQLVLREGDPPEIGVFKLLSGKLYYSMSLDNGDHWERQVATTTDSNHGFNVLNFHAAKDAAGIVHVVYENTGRIYYTNTTKPFGGVDVGLGMGADPSIAADSQGGLHAVCLRKVDPSSTSASDPKNAVYRYSEVGGWRWNTEEVIDANGINMILPTVAANDQGVYLLWSGKVQSLSEDMEVFCARRSPVSGWSAIKRITENVSDSLVRPLAVSDLGIHAVVNERTDLPASNELVYSNIIDLSMPIDSRGYVKGNVSSDGQGLAGVEMILTGPATHRLRTDTQGDFLFSRIPAGTYTLTPLLGAAVFSPSGRQFTVDASGVSSMAFSAATDTTADGHWVVQHLEDGVTLEDVFFIDGLKGWAAGSTGSTYSDGVIFRTADGGTHWEKIEYPDIPGVYSLNAIFFVDSHTGWIGGDGGHVIKTTNGGLTWSDKRMSVDCCGADIEDFYFKDVLNGWAVGHYALVSYTTDGGETWTQMSKNLFRPAEGFESLNDIGFFNDEAAWMMGKTSGVTGGTRLYFSFDGGQTWDQTRSLPAGMVSFSFLDTHIGVGSGFTGGLIVNTADGYTFDSRNTGDPVTQDTLKGAAMVSRDRAWIVGDRGGSNYGDYGGTIVTTFDGGDTWKLQQSPTNQHLAKVFFLDPKTGWAVGSDGTILRYHGTGSWTPPFPGKVSGRVTDSTTGTGAEGVTVTLTPGGRTAVTNPFGLYTIPDVADDVYSVTAEKPGFGVVTAEGIEVSGGTITVNLANASGEAPWEEDNSAIWSESNGTYTMSGTGAGLGRILSYPIEMCDFQLEVDVAKTKGSSASPFGIHLRTDSDGDSLYQFLITAEGAFKVSKWTEGVESILHDYGQAQATGLLTGFNTVNVVKIVAKDNHLAFSANQALLFEYTDTDSPLTCGRIQLFALDSGDAVSPDFDTVQFGNIHLSIPADSLHFTTPLLNVIQDNPFYADVAVRDTLGDVAVSDNTTQVTIALKDGTGTPDAVLTGTTTVTVSAGVAHFGPLSIDKAGMGYRLSATAAELTGAESTSFDVVAFLKGDFDGNGALGLPDLIRALQVVAGIKPSYVNVLGDINADGKIGLADALYVLDAIAAPEPVSEENRQLAVQTVDEAMPLINSGDFAAAKVKFAEALQADPGNPEANTGYYLSVRGENAETLKGVFSGFTQALAGNDLSSNYDIILQAASLLQKLPFIDLSTFSSAQGTLALRSAQETYEIDIDLDVPNSLKEIVLRITNQVPVLDKSYFASMAYLKSLLDSYKSQIGMVLPFVREAETHADLNFEVATDAFYKMFDLDLDGDGIQDLVLPNDKVAIDQGDLYILDAGICFLIGLGNVFDAYSFDGSTFDVAGDTNQDGYISPDEYLPPVPYYTLVPGGAAKLEEAMAYFKTAVEKIDAGISISLAETEDYYEIFPVNTDPGFRAFVESLKSNSQYLDLGDLKGALNGSYTFDMGKGPFYLTGQSITIDILKFFTNPQDFRFYLPQIRLSDQSMIYPVNPTLGGMIPNGDLADVLNHALGISTLTSIPIIRSLAPAEVQLGGTVTISGEGFGTSQVAGGISIAGRPVPASSILSWTDSEIRFEVPSDILSGRLTVTAGGIRSNSLRMSISGMTVDNFDEVPSALMAGDPPTTIDSGLFIYDIYDTANPSGASKSDWKIEDGYLREGSDIYYTGGTLAPETNPARGSNLIMQGESLADGIVVAGFWNTTGITEGSDNDGIGILFGYQDEDNFYRLMSVRDDYWDKGPWIRLERWTNGEMTVLALSQDPADVYKSVADDGLAAGDINELRIEIQGTRIKAYIKLYQDGVWGASRLVFDVTDAQYAGGRIGISTYSVWWAYIDYIALQ